MLFSNPGIVRDGTSTTKERELMGRGILLKTTVLRTTPTTVSPAILSGNRCDQITAGISKCSVMNSIITL